MKNSGTVSSAGIALQPCLRSRRMPGIETITQDGTTHVRQVNANLVRATGFGENANERESTDAIDHFVKCIRRFAGHVVLADRHLVSLVRVTPDRGVDDVAIPVD